ncbi:hypothetical protein C8F01DRAFT_1342338 [Mycena amicta]|nr:hypothetical protein C8F01DRAFT_1342338 [Mycena amicta]
MGLCKNPPETPLRIAPWQSALVATAMVGAMVAIFMLLTILHKRHSLDKSRELRDYCYQQLNLRKTIIRMRAAGGDKVAEDQVPLRGERGSVE